MWIIVVFLHFLVASQHENYEFLAGFGLISSVVRLCGPDLSVQTGETYPTLTLMAVQTQK